MASSAAKTAQSHKAGAGVVRIIGGQWRRRLLPVPVRDGLRPTPDRVRETLFNWLGQDLAGWHCLDAFAGTGALGFEAASRHAAAVVLVEKDAQVARQLQQSADKLEASNLQIRQGDGLAALKTNPAVSASERTGWDVIFLDPPFATDLDAQALPLAHAVLADDGFVYLESARHWQEDTLAQHGWVLKRYLKAGQVHAHLLQKMPN